MKNDNHVWDNKHPTAQMLGRWQPWHAGHQKLFEETLKKTGQVNIMVRDVKGVDDNPFDFESVKKNILEALKDFKNPHSPGTKGVANLPNIFKELFGGGNALADSHGGDDATEEEEVETEAGATAAADLTKGQTKLDANVPDDGDITVQTKYDDGDSDIVSNVVSVI